MTVVVLNKLSLFSQAAVLGSTWLSSSMVQEVLRLMAKETSEDASTLWKRLSAGLTSEMDKPESESFCTRPGLGLSSTLDDIVGSLRFWMLSTV